MIKKLLQSDEIRVSLVAGICIILVAIVVKKILHLEAVPAFRNGPIIVIILYIITRGAYKKCEKKPKWDRPLYWSLALICISIITVLTYLI